MGPKPLVIFGASPVARVVAEYFRVDSDHEVVAFCVDRSFLETNEMLGLPVVAKDEVVERFDPKKHSAFAAIGAGQLNRVRRSFLDWFKQEGYTPARYISSKAFIWPNATVGEHCMVGEYASLHPFTSLGDNCFFWTGSQLAHEATMGQDCFVSSHVIIGGKTQVGSGCFIGMNSCVIDNLSIGDDTIIGAGATVTKSYGAGHVLTAPRATPRPYSAYQHFGMDDPGEAQ